MESLPTRSNIWRSFGKKSEYAWDFEMFLKLV